MWQVGGADQDNEIHWFVYLESGRAVDYRLVKLKIHLRERERERERERDTQLI